MTRCYTFLRFSDPVHRHFNFFLIQKRVSISNQIAIRNIVDVPKTLNNSTRHYTFVKTKQIKLCMVKFTAGPIIKLLLSDVNVRNLYIFQILINILASIGYRRKEKINI